MSALLVIVAIWKNHDRDMGAMERGRLTAPLYKINWSGELREWGEHGLNWGISVGGILRRVGLASQWVHT